MWKGEGLERLCTSGSWPKPEERVGGQSCGRDEGEEDDSKGEEDEWESNPCGPALDERGGPDDNEQRSCELGASPTPASCSVICDRVRDKSR